MKTIYIIGAQSTGKTTLVNNLENEIKKCSDGADIFVIREVARKVLSDKGFSRNDITESKSRALQLQHHILQAQYNAETEASQSDTTTWCICDRSGLDPIVYTKLFVGQDATERILASNTWLELEARMKEGIVILCEADCHWLKDDGVRLMPKDTAEWLRVDAAFRELLETRGIDHHILSKSTTDIGERVDFVKSFM